MASDLLTLELDYVRRDMARDQRLTVLERRIFELRAERLKRRRLLPVPVVR